MSPAAAAAAAVAAAVVGLQLDYLDLYLIHWPVTGCVGPTLTPSTAETWCALEACADGGLTRSIGVSNFSAAKLQQLLDSPGIKIRPAVLQVRRQLASFLALQMQAAQSSEARPV
jgi:diketogulonate reductase-like aldo/keto reductase